MKTHQDYLKEIAATGLSQAQIGERIGGKTQSWVSAAMNGVYSDLKWREGQAIRRLHAEVCGAAEKKCCECGEATPEPEVRARTCPDRRDDERRATGAPFGEFGERRGTDRREDDRRAAGCSEVKSA